MPFALCRLFYRTVSRRVVLLRSSLYISFRCAMFLCIEYGIVPARGALCSPAGYSYYAARFSSYRSPVTWRKTSSREGRERVSEWGCRPLSCRR